LRDDDTVIEGLYAAGNVSAPMKGHIHPAPSSPGAPFVEP
jgi:3-oxosteroid 1-dehydrogenase